jgi:DNA helicase-2/ATP-dependent DNA helicase PcrA
VLAVGPAGAGKTVAMMARLRLLLERDAGAPERAVLLVASESLAAGIRARLGEEPGAVSCEEAVLTFPALCERLLRAEASEAGLDPFFVTATRADRVALLVDRIEELTLARHELQGRPARLMANIVGRIDALKAQLIDAERFAAWARGLAGRVPEWEASRELEFAQLYTDHDRMLAERATPDPGELLLRTRALLERSRAAGGRIAERCRHVLVDDFQRASPAEVAVIELLAREHGGLAVAADARPAVAPAWARGNVERLRASHPGWRVVELTRNLRSAAPIAALAEGVLEELPAAGQRKADAGDGPPAELATAAESRATGPAAGQGPVEFWRAANERAQAQCVAADIARLIAREGVEPPRIGVLLGSLGAESQAIAGALAERGIPHRLVGGAALFERAEVRDVLAWMRLLIDPGDTAAVVRVLARPPIELRQVDLARVVQIARRRKLDMITALAAAVDSPQIPPEARERIQVLLRLHGETAAELDTIRPDLFVHRLIERLGLRRQRLFAAHADVVEGLLALARLGELAGAFVRRAARASGRELAEQLAAISEAGLPVQEGVVQQLPEGVQVRSMASACGQEFEHVYVLGLHAGLQVEDAGHSALPELSGARDEAAEDADDSSRRSLYLAFSRARERLVLVYPSSSPAGSPRRPLDLVERARLELHLAWIDREEDLFGPAETVHGTLRAMREELLADLARVAGRLGELRLDTELDVAHGVVRYLELLKLAALIERPPGQSIAESLPDINARLLAASTSLEGEILQSSTLDESLLGLERDRQAGVIRAGAAGASPEEPSLAPFLPRSGAGLVLSASDVETYTSCPLRYKFARVFRIPTAPTINQRFGIVVHQVLERYHATQARELSQMIDLLDAGWRRSGFGDGEQERQLYRKARESLVRYHGRLREQRSEPVWFERPFSFRLGPHQVRGRVDRVDRLPDAEGHELIDYKTGLPRSQEQLRHDIQLSLYALAAGEAWQLETATQAYYYVLNDRKVQLPRADGDREWIRETVLEVAAAILEQEFEPTPSIATCATCDYRIMCPAAET